MDDRTTPRTDFPRRPGAEGRAATGLVASYIHELSERHGGGKRRQASPLAPGSLAEGGRRQQPGSAIYTENPTAREPEQALSRVTQPT
jgi:hypothetical protein